MTQKVYLKLSRAMQLTALPIRYEFQQLGNFQLPAKPAVETRHLDQSIAGHRSTVSVDKN